ncbi:SIS domain-containing protein [Caulobacter mirabilis]|uniref:Iron dicitrate transport regulator FecR n=1 Tax=Caulobacter mirabilis TaxID=69666 RepID=A0A2D2B1J4_9CAUL|nr:SIS domain-containing protein [Caulobacter mirabilis]ATQ44129.1 iron dicitrate transport regulator FecR [Caulobacter mirabilis]
MESSNVKRNPGSPEGSRMFLETAQAPGAVAGQLEINGERMARLGARLREMNPRAVVTCARGSSDHAATYGRYLLEMRAGVLTSSFSPSVSSVYARTPNFEGVVYLAISQSGRSPDLLAATEAAKKAGAYVVVLVNDINAPLAELADEAIPLRAGPETSVAATKSYITSLTALANLAAAWTDDKALLCALDQLPEQLTEALALDWSPAVEALAPATNLFVIGRGPGFGVAQEAALKLKETCGLHAEAFSAAEVAHGPRALVKPGFPTLVFAQDDETRAGVEATAADLAARGANMLFAGVNGPEGALPALAAHPALEPILMIQSFYRMANALSFRRGFDPDQPPNLRKVTETR